MTALVTVVNVSDRGRNECWLEPKPYDPGESAT